MKSLRTYCAALMLLLAAPALATDGFFVVAPDIPLLPGFVELEEQENLFDQPDGRIATLVAEGAGKAEQVSETYAESLQAMGWEPAAEGSFQREDEALNLSVESLSASGGQVRVEITVTPLH